MEKVVENCCKLVLSCESDLTFNFEKAVCNHGFFMMAPNYWIPSTKTLQRPLRLSDSLTSVRVSIWEQNAIIHIRVHDKQDEDLTCNDKSAIKEQVSRMLRLSKKDESDVTNFHKLHSHSKEVGFGRLFRSPTFFEDVIKSILLSHCRWSRALSMAEALCDLQSDMSSGLISKDIGSVITRTRKRKREGEIKRKGKGKKKNTSINNCTKSIPKSSEEFDKTTLGNFPTSKEIASVSEEFLKKHCNLGFRAKWIKLFAIKVEAGFRLDKFDRQGVVDYEQINNALKRFKGLGSFVCNNVMMCIGIYRSIPIDSETIRHLQQVHNNKKRRKKNNYEKDVKEIYDKYAPFQCLAYWMELLEFYEEKVGKLSELPRSKYDAVSGNLM